MSWLSRMFRPPAPRNDRETFREAIGIDVSGPEFFDLYPSRVDILRRLKAAGVFRDAHLLWALDMIMANIGSSTSNIIKTLERSGDLLPREELKSLGYHPTKKLGRRFVNAIAANDVKAATERLETLILIATATANKLHNLRRFEKAGITRCTVSPSGDERDTALERELAGRTVTIDEARRLTLKYEEDLQRTVFLAEVEF